MLRELLTHSSTAFGILCALLAMSLAGCVTGARQAAQAKHDIRLELRILKANVSPLDSLDVELVIRNDGKRNVKIPTAKGKEGALFFDFLVLSDAGHMHRVRRSVGWNDPEAKKVEMVLLAPKGTWRIVIEDAIKLRSIPELSAYKRLRCTILAIYRDHSYGHSPTYPEYRKDDPLVWKGTLISRPAVINVESDKAR